MIDLRNIKNVINDDFYPLLSNRNRYLVLRGGRGSGKSYFVAQKILLRILKAYETGVRHKFICCRKYSPDVKRSVFELFKQYIDEWNLYHLCKIVNNPPTITFTNGSKIICSGIDDPMKLKSITGITGAWLEEAMELTHEDFLSVDQIIRGQFKDYHQIILSFNPTSKDSWLYNEFYSQDKPDSTTHLSTYKSNRFLNPEYGEMLESYANTSQFHYQVNCLGEWAVLDGLCFENWTVTDEIPSGNDFVYGCDFGYSNDQTAVTKVWREGQSLFVQEKLYKLKMTNEDLIEWFLTYTEPSALVYCDSAEPARIESMKRAGISARPCTKGKWSIKNGIMFIKEHNLKIIDGSENLRKEIAGYTWKKKNGTYIDEPIDTNNHLIDSMRYATFSQWFKKNTPLEIIWI
jgi:phage terminase large subunit